QQCKQGVFIGVNIGWQPQRCPSVVVHVVAAPMCKRITPECLDKAGKMLEVLLWLRPRPTRSRVRAKRQYHGVNGWSFIGCCGDLDRQCCHGGPPVIADGLTS